MEEGGHNERKRERERRREGEEGEFELCNNNLFIYKIFTQCVAKICN